MNQRTRSRRNLAVALLSLAVAAGMAGLAYASVPLYRLFCQITGYGGTTQQATQAPQAVTGTSITVRLDANVNSALPWRFEPLQPALKLSLGEAVTAVYRVTNLSAEPTVGSATFNVTPFVAGPYFSKIECFCFVEQALAPGESAELPVTFFVDPAIAADPGTAAVRTITLSYTFFRVPEPESKVSNRAAERIFN
jgi:cytochrome c oxidase assembly protein subunit 11